MNLKGAKDNSGQMLNLLYNKHDKTDKGYKSCRKCNSNFDLGRSFSIVKNLQ